ncbi:FKBP-type peptidyl-prolyl cis-trans isomerase [Neolewinella litorea]|uniref:Peptidyl-prolyl cis-trans isomerase n=2 Tax=Neolewinella litorea TaxID=2562452 RepID=A0A4S4NS48_9BACT|nr:FKBP-type peptidyl-prolyl cis-trans isomerase [Neolewinella litorea]
MKPWGGTLVLLLFTTAVLTAQNQSSYMDTTSYSLGIVLSQNLKSQGFDSIDASSLAKGFEDGLSGSGKVSPEQANQYIQQYLQKAAAAAGAEARQEGEAFLAHNAKRPEVKVTESGLQYEVLQEGSGASPSATETVKVHYHGTLIDGSVFDSSVERGQTIEFPLNRVIRGWTEGLQLMKEGAKYRFFIPYDLAYGEQGSPPAIPPYAALIFDVELFEVK